MYKLILLLLFTAQFSFAHDCSIFKDIEAAGLYQNDKFWEEFAKLSDKGTPSESEVGALIAKYKGSSAPTPAKDLVTSQAPAEVNTAARASQVGQQAVRIQKAAEKHILNAPKQVQKKLEELIAIINKNGIKQSRSELSNNSWNLEPNRQTGAGAYSVRLNNGYRALLKIEGDNITILDVGNNVYRH